MEKSRRRGKRRGRREERWWVYEKGKKVEERKQED
jgi:hypothetical protein